MARGNVFRRGGATGVGIARIAVGVIWLAGAMFNALITLRMDDPYGWIANESRSRFYRWVFAEVIGARPAAWTVLLIAGEAALGVLTLARGGLARLGLVGGACFSAFLFSLATPYTLVMGPYALLLAWLGRRTDSARSADRLRSLGLRRAIRGVSR